MIRNFDELMKEARGREAGKIAIAAPEESGIIQLVKKATEQGIAQFILVGDQGRIRELLETEGLRQGSVEIHDRPDHGEAAEEAVSLIREKKAGVLMKGELHTSTFLKAVLDKEKGLRTGSLISQITVCEKVEGEGLLLITDCAMNIRPNLEEKKQIIENAVELARRLGCERPKVAVLSAVEVVNQAIPDTLDAAVLSKMSERGQIQNAVVDGPLALDNAISVAAARQKKIGGEVAGRADIILVPNLQAGNPIHKALTFFADRKIAASVMGATAPIVMLSRADSIETKLRSIALAAYTS
jgi:phosphate butyryltransferase